MTKLNWNRQPWVLNAQQRPARGIVAPEEVVDHPFWPTLPLDQLEDAVEEVRRGVAQRRSGIGWTVYSVGNNVVRIDLKKVR